MASNTKIALIYPTGNLFVAPSVHAAIELLAQNQYEVDVLTVRNTTSPKVKFNNPKIAVSYFPWVQKQRKEQRSLLTLFFTFWIIVRSYNNKYHFLFAVGERGLLSSVIPALLFRTPFAYYCLEIMFKEKFGIIRNFLVSLANRKAKFTTIQDSNRARLLVREHRIQLKDTVIIPNARAGKAERINSRYLHDRLKIPKDKTIVLCAGGMMKAALFKEIVISAQEWPDKYILVVHSGIIYNENYLSEVLSSDYNNKVIFSLNPLTIEEMDKMVSSSDIGLVFYDEYAGLDYKNIGLASGKVSQYLRNGIPIIVNDVKSLARIINQYNIGTVVKDEKGILQAIKSIKEDYKFYVSNCLVCYNGLISPDRYFREVAKRLNAII